FGPRGIITYGVFGQTPIIFGLLGIWGVQTIAFFPFAYQLIADALSRSDARMEQAARNLGAGPWRVFRTVTLPLSRPGLGAAILMVYGTLLVSALTVLFPINLAPTARHFTFVVTGSNGDALRNTLVFSSVAALVSAIFALFAGWLVQRGDWPGRRVLDFVLIL